MVRAISGRSTILLRTLSLTFEVKECGVIMTAQLEGDVATVQRLRARDWDLAPKAGRRRA